MKIKRNASKAPPACCGRKEPEWHAAESRVSAMLADLLFDGYLVLSDVKFRYGNIDHVVFRPDGTIFLIETKSHRGIVSSDRSRILLNGAPLRMSPIRQVMRSIRWVRDLAKRLFGRNPWIVAVLVFPNAKVQVRHSVKRVNVLAAADLLRFIRTYRRKN